MVEMKNHQPFKEWHKDNLVELLEFIRTRYPAYFEDIMNDYDEWKRGN